MASPLLLEGNIDSRDETIARLNVQVRQLDEALRHERIRTASIESGVRELKQIFNPLYRALQKVYGEFDAMALDDEQAAAQFNPKWDAWKQKLGPGTAPARVIDSLLAHGPLNRSQLRQAGQLGWSTLDAATARLKNLSLIEKQGDRWHLKG